MLYNDVIKSYFIKIAEKNTINWHEINEHYSKRLDVLLLKRRIITPEEMLKFYLYFFKIPLYKNGMFRNSNSLIGEFDSFLVEKYHVLPLGIYHKKLLVLTSDPFSTKGLVLLKKKYLLNIELYLTTFDELKKIYIENTSDYRYEGLKKNDSELNTVKLVDTIITKAIETKSSDIHIEPSKIGVRVRYRQNGVLELMQNISIEQFNSLAARIKVISDMDPAKSKISQEGRINYIFRKQSYDLRVSTIPTLYKERIVIRILNNSDINLNIKNLNYDSSVEKHLIEMLNSKKGLVLVTGPTGSGKTTSLYSFINCIDKKHNSIITIEDPVEYVISDVSQVVVNGNSQLTFSSALRNILRQDPNVIFIGEIRDNETAIMACNMAMTGHLVLSSMHTNTIEGVIFRLLDMGVEAKSLVDSLLCIMNQRLVREVCPHCRKVTYIDEENALKYGLNKGEVVYESSGCSECNYTGYIGRILIHDIYFINKKVKEEFMKEGDIGILTTDINSLKSQKFLCSAKKLLKEGKTTVEELNRLDLE